MSDTTPPAIDVRYRLTGKSLSRNFRPADPAVRVTPKFPQRTQSYYAFLGEIDDPIFTTPGKTEHRDLYLNTLGNGELVSVFSSRLGSQSESVFPLMAANTLQIDGPSTFAFALRLAIEAGLVEAYSEKPPSIFICSGDIDSL